MDFRDPRDPLAGVGYVGRSCDVGSSDGHSGCRSARGSPATTREIVRDDYRARDSGADGDLRHPDVFGRGVASVERRDSRLEHPPGLCGIGAT